MKLAVVVFAMLGALVATAVAIAIVDGSAHVPQAIVAPELPSRLPGFREPPAPPVGPVAPGPVSSVEPFEDAQQDVARMRMAESYVPPLEDVRFGPNVIVNRFKPSWVIMDAIATGRTLYVIYEPDELGRLEYVAELDGETLIPVALPHVYASLAFIDDGEFVSGTRPRGGDDWFVIRGRRAFPVARPSPRPADHALYRLSDGNRCFEGASGSGVAIGERDGSGHARPLVTSAALKAATGGILDEGWAPSCHHFGGEDFATINAGLSIVLRISHGKAEPIATGEIMASDDDAFLLRNGEYWLLEARTRR